MWKTQPNFTSRQLAAVKLPVVISDGQYDEIIKREETGQLAREIPAAQLVIQAGVSHFAMLQGPAEFTKAIEKFLQSIT